MSMFITLAISSLIFLLTFISLKTDAKRNFKSEIISLGVFGTFIGILLGLYNFDTQHIERSLPLLLSGLKTAFITSGVGMFCSLVISLFKPSAMAKITLADISLNQTKMIEALDNAMNKVSSSANEEIIISLKQVVNEFNSQLDEQFGQNFKELNQAVKKMIVWQEQYKSQITMHDESVKTLYQQFQQLADFNTKQESNIKLVTSNMLKTSNELNESLKNSTNVMLSSMNKGANDISKNLKSSTTVILSNMTKGANELNGSLQKSTSIVEENLQLILREANSYA